MDIWLHFIITLMCKNYGGTLFQEDFKTMLFLKQWFSLLLFLEMRLSWQAEWVEWENNVSCSPAMLQVKIGQKKCPVQEKTDIHKGTAIFLKRIFQNTFVLLCNSPVLKQRLSFSFFSFSFSPLSFFFLFFSLFFFHPKG